VGYVSEPSRILPLDIVRKRGLKFALDDSVHNFLESLSELNLAYEVSDDAMLHAVPELLKGQAILWFRNNQHIWDTWESFLSRNSIEI
jgi:hypothetical protein